MGDSQAGSDPSGFERYEVLDTLGEGVSSVVYRARDPRTNSTVALKVLNPHLASDEISLERFRREIQIARHLNHPQIVAIYDLVVEPERIFLVMECLEGTDLKDFIALEHPIPLETCVGIAAQILAVLSVCHAKDVIHRDLKPQNVFASPDRRVKLLDFGISRMTSLRDLTQTGSSLGSPEYMAPELFATDSYDPRTDLYAVGAIAFELLTGRLPFQGDTLTLLFRQHLEDPVPKLRELRSDAPAWLEAWVERLLAKDAHARYQSADEALEDLRNERVLVRELPALPSRDCPNCSESTPDELPICTRCGFDARALLEPGRIGLYCSQDADDEKLGELLGELLDVRLPRKRRGRTLVMARLDPLAADLIRDRARRRGLYLHSARAPKRPFALALAKLAAWWVLPSLAFLVVIPPVYLWLYGSGYSWAIYVWSAIAAVSGLGILVALITGPLTAWDTLRRARPLVSPESRAGSRVAPAFEFLGEILPAISRLHSKSLRRSLGALVEKHLLLTGSGARIEASVQAGLEGALRSGRDLALLASEIEEKLENAGVARMAERYDALASRVAGEADAAARGALEREKEGLAAQLRAAWRLEEHHAALTARLVSAQAAVNRLLGVQLVLEGSLDALDLESLEREAARLAEGVLLSREIEKELEALA